VQGGKFLPQLSFRFRLNRACLKLSHLAQVQAKKTALLFSQSVTSGNSCRTHPTKRSRTGARQHEVGRDDRSTTATVAPLKRKKNTRRPKSFFVRKHFRTTVFRKFCPNFFFQGGVGAKKEEAF